MGRSSAGAERPPEGLQAAFLSSSEGVAGISGTKTQGSSFANSGACPEGPHNFSRGAESGFRGQGAARQAEAAIRWSAEGKDAETGIMPHSLWHTSFITNPAASFEARRGDSAPPGRPRQKASLNEQL